MNKITLLLSSALFVCFLKPMAQPVISVAVYPLNDDSVFYQAVSNTAFNPGATGANVTWDFSSLTPFGSPVPQVIVSPSETSFGDSFPSANQAFTSLVAARYYQRGSSQYTTVGSIEGYDFIHYSNPEILMKFPFTYNNNFADSFSAEVYSDNNGHYLRKGQSTVVADGYGTLKLPIGTYHNVLRVKTTELYSDFFPDYNNVHLDNTNIIYSWYQEGVKGALLTHTLEFGTGGDTAVVYAYNAGLVSTGIREQSAGSGLNVYPNPANSCFYIAANEAWDTYTLFDVSGRIVKQGVLRTEQINRISVEDIQRGLYLLECKKTSCEVLSKKILISQ